MGHLNSGRKQGSWALGFEARRVGIPVVGILLLMAAIMSSACGKPNGEGDETCLEDEHCGEGLICADGVCVEPAAPLGGLGDACDDEAPCEEPLICEEGSCAEPECLTAHDCLLGDVCKEGNCQEFDATLACANDGYCPADHVCNFGTCEGCSDDSYCVSSRAGPKCAVNSSEPVPVGFCYQECGPDVDRECQTGFVCDTDKGGLCMKSCEQASDCDDGQTCVDSKCGPCTDDSQCEEPKVCYTTMGECLEPYVCTDEGCERMGAAFFCNDQSGQCSLGCTSHLSGSCDDLEISECNPCPEGESCDLDERRCSGAQACDCATLACESWGLICDTRTCSCIDG